MKKITLLLMVALAAITMSAATITIPEEAKAWNIPAEAIDVLQAREICAGLEADVPTTKMYYVMGYVKRVSSKNAETVSQYGQARFYLENVKGANSEEEFDAYQVYGLNGVKINNPDVVAAGDFVVIYGPLTKHQYEGGDVAYQTPGKGAAYIWNSTNPKLHNDTVTNPETPTDESLVIPEEAKAWNIPAGAIDVLKAREICAGLANNATTGTKYYVMGYVKKIHNKHADGVANFGNAQFYMENVKGGNSQNDFMAYQVYGPNGQQITDVNSVAVGDFVVVYGELTNYNGTYETVGKGAAYIWNSTNPLLSSTTPPTPPVNPEDEKLVIPEEAKSWNIPAEAIDVLKAREICAGLASDATTGTKYYVMGYVKKLHKNHESGVSGYGNATFYMENVKGGNSQNDFLAFQVYGLNGEKITDPNVVAVGDFVVVYGELTNYKGNTYETVGKGAAYIWKSTNPLLAGDPNLVTVKDLVYADAYYSEEDGVGYYNLDMYKDYEDDYTYPRLDVTVKAISKTALNGTYELLEATYYASADALVAMGETAGTLTIKNVDTEGTYSVKGSFVGTDGKTYKFDQNLKLGAYDMDDNEITLEEPSLTKGKGTKEDPYSIADVLALNNSVSGKYYVRGYIIGHVNGASIATGLDTEAPFEAAEGATQGTNLMLSDAKNDITNIVPLQLPAGELRAAFNLVEHPDMCGKAVLVYGSLEAYFKLPGVKSPESIELIDVFADVENVTVGETPVKVIENGQLMIIRGENVYNVLGAQVK